MSDAIKVTSHVGRDLLQSSAYFNTVPKVVWEYVSNSIDNPEGADPVTVEVEITPASIIIADNARGMDRADLQRFFQMHGENIQRKRGKHVRGRFGTGKCAAFGVAGVLRVETVRAGKLCVAELSRDDVLESTGDDIPVRMVADNVDTEAGNGTTIVISAVEAKNLEIPATIAYVERHLGRQRQKHSVAINRHVCEIVEPVALRSAAFHPPPEVAAHLGDVELTLKVGAAPAAPEDAGVDVFSYGNWHDTTLASVPPTDLARRIFGEVDVKALEDYEGPFPPFDNTRSNKLSQQNPLVAILFGWLGKCIREVLGELESEEAERRKTAEAKRLRETAKDIEQLLNKDFATLELELEKIRQAARHEAAPPELVGTGARNPDSEQILPDDEGDTPLDVEPAGPEPGTGTRPKEPAGREGPESGSGLKPGDAMGAERDPIERPPRRNSGFNLDFRHLTEEQSRSTFDEATRTIIVNLDHPQLKAALGLGGIDSDGFKQVSYEVAIVEYSIVVGHERRRKDPYLSAEDALYEIRSTINRVSRVIRGAP